MDTLISKLAKAEELAGMGKVSKMKIYLGFVDIIAIRLGIDVSPQRADVEQLGYHIGIPISLSEASMYAGKGNAQKMEEHLVNANVYANKLGMDISYQTQAIRTYKSLVAAKNALDSL